LADLELRRRLQVTRKGKGEDQTLVQEYMSHEVRSIHKEATIKQAGQVLQKYKIGSLIVDDGSRYVGIITESDLTRRAVAKGLDPNATSVATCMSRSLVTIEEDESLADARSLMKKHGIRHLPVTADATIIGVLSVSDLLRAFEAQRSA